MADRILIGNKTYPEKFLNTLSEAKEKFVMTPERNTFRCT